ncbi:hypothetical protein HA402_000958 [Bradysia odoriphaga]|nr:hypothetical protein HA402_000958 [Bradysia odoriphaga]
MEEVQSSETPPLFDNIDFNTNDQDYEIFESAVQQQQSVSKSTTMEDVATEEMTDQFIEITVSEPHKIGDGIGSYIAYKVSTRSSIPAFKKRQFSVMRRFSDFLGIHGLLVEKYLRRGRIIPPAPEKNLIGSTKVKMSQTPSAETANGVGMEWLENRRAALERFLCRTAKHPVLCTDPDFINFLQSDEELPKSVNTAALSGAGVMRLFNKVGETMNKITYKMDENDPWFEDKIIEIENLDTHMQRLHSAIKSLVIYRKELSSLTGSVAKSAAVLSTCEEHTGLSRALSQLADVEEKVELLRSEQSNSDLYILSETLKDYIGLFGAIKDVFHERVKVFQNWEHAQLQLTKRRENKTRMELAGRNDKVEQYEKEVEEWETKVQRCQKEFEEISAEIKRETERFEIDRVREFKTTIIKYLEDQMAHQQQVIKYWDAFVPNAKEIN